MRDSIYRGQCIHKYMMIPTSYKATGIPLSTAMLLLLILRTVGVGRLANIWRLVVL